MPKSSNKQVSQEDPERVEEFQNPQPEEKSEPKKYRYTGKAVMHFTHQGRPTCSFPMRCMKTCLSVSR